MVQSRRSYVQWHGRVVLERTRQQPSVSSWVLPEQTFVASTNARPEYTDIPAHEYQDSDEVLNDKVTILLECLRDANLCVAYTGAGLSVASGLDDYATNRPSLQERGQGPLAAPSIGHITLASLYSMGWLQHVVNQNHDGLVHKAGIPASDITEIHGGWFDPSNPGGNLLRGDLLEKVEELSRQADLCLTLGSSLSELTADQLATKVATRPRNPGKLILVNLQQTPLDDICYLRIFGKIETVFSKLAQRLYATLPPPPVAMIPSLYTNVFPNLPYDPATGQRSSTANTTLDLSPNAQVTIVQGNFDGCLATVLERTNGDFWKLSIHQRLALDDSQMVEIQEEHLLGVWFITAALQGTLPCLPVVPPQ